MGKVVRCLLATLGLALGVEWETVEVDGAKCVPLSQVADFYRLEKPVMAEGGVTLRNQEITLVFEVESRKASFNKVGFLLGEKLLKSEEAYHLSLEDLSGLLEPVLRPQKVQGLGNFDRVVLDLDFSEGLPEREALIEALRSNLQNKGFKVVVFGDREDGRLDWAKFRERAEGNSTVMIHFAILDGERMALQSQAIGGSPKPGLSLATGIHWRILQQLKWNAGLANLEDGRISVERAGKFQEIDVPACHLAMTYDFSRKVTAKKFHRTVAQSVAEAITFARKAGQ